MRMPLVGDLYCGLGGWAEGFISEGYRVKGYDIEKHDYGTGTYPGELFIRDVRSLHGRELKDAVVIVGSPPCQEPSYRAMPWKRAKALNELGPPVNFLELFNACFRIQREASEAAGRYIPLIVENVRGAQKWVGRARWHYGSYYLWGDVPALMPIALGQKFNPDGTEHAPGSWFAISDSKERGARTIKVPGLNWKIGSLTYTKKAFNDTAVKRLGVATRKAASAQIAKIPFPLAQHIARCFKPEYAERLLEAKQVLA